MSYRFHKPYLQQAVTHQRPAGVELDPTRRRNDSTERDLGETEVRIDTTLEASFPASDPPSWTLDDSHHDQTPVH